MKQASLCKNLMYSDCGKHCVLGKKKSLWTAMTEKYYTYDGGSEVVSIYT